MATVLIVDDDDSVVQMLCEVLDLEGIRGIGVSDPTHVMTVGAVASPDVILLDLMLPGRCGVEVAQELREGGFSQTPIVGMTGSQFLAEVARETDLFTDVVEKPFELDDLLIMLTEAAAAAA